MTRAEFPSPDAAKQYRYDLQDAFEVIRNNDLPKMDALAWPAGLDRRILEGLPLQTRTRNCLHGAGLLEGESPLTVHELLCLPNFGRASLDDLLFTVDNFLCECSKRESADSELEDAEEPRHGTADVAPEPSWAPWERARKALNALLAAAAELNGTKTLADALSPECRRLASRMGIATEIEEIMVDRVVEGSAGPTAVIAMRLKALLEQLTPRQWFIVEQRMLTTPPKTLEEVAARFEVTRERIRQIQLKAERRVRAAFGNELQIVAGALKEELGNIVEDGAVNRRIDALLPDDHNGRTTGVKKLFRKAVIDKMGLTLRQGMYLDEQALEELEIIRATTRRLADDIGLVDEQELIASLPSAEWRSFWPWARERCEFYEFFGSVSIRDSGKARAKAALISIGRPATREEIARICGFTANKTGSHLSVIPSVVKADKDRWGLKEWVDDEYDGITGEIIQRIEEDGGATRIERLLTELPNKFGVGPNSVRAYMQTAKFVINDGWISLARKSAIRLRDLEDVIDGRDDTGAPYWTFSVEARYFDGYSVPTVPPEFAKALGCAPDAGAHVQIENLPGCRDLSIRWPLASITGASLGYVGEPLKQLGLKPGEWARITIKGPCLVELTLDDNSAQHSQESGANAILDRMMRRRKVL